MVKTTGCPIGCPSQDEVPLLVDEFHSSSIPPSIMKRLVPFTCRHDAATQPRRWIGAPSLFRLVCRIRDEESIASIDEWIPLEFLDIAGDIPKQCGV